jgi:hypothetical protein
VTPRVGVRLLVAAAVAAVVAAVVAGIVAVGPPSLERQKKLDEIRVADLAAIERLISSFTKIHKGLPRDLAALAQEPGYEIPRTDPESKTPYEYEVLSADGYRLCAHFSTRSTRERAATIYLPAANTWSHGAGKQCFNRRVDPGTGDHP